MSALVVIVDANGDHLLTVGPFENEVAAKTYCDARFSKRGEWYLQVQQSQVTPEMLDWEAGSDVYQALRKIGR